MTSKQLAKRGPKTAPGKLAVSTNASTHGILSPRPVVAAYESQGAWKAHRQAILDSLDPQGGIEQALAERVALCSWRLNRVIFYETEGISGLQETVVKDVEERGRLFPSLYGKDPTDTSALDKVKRARITYEDVCALFDEGNGAHELSVAGVDWLFLQAPYFASELWAYQQLEANSGPNPEESINEDEILEQSDVLEDKLRERVGEAYAFTASEMREHLAWVADEAGIEDDIGVDGKVSYTPVEGLLEKLHTVAKAGLETAEDKAREIEQKILNKRRARILPEESDLQKISRYEAHISREMYKALHELEALQTHRTGGVAPLARVDVQGDELPKP